MNDTPAHAKSRFRSGWLVIGLAAATLIAIPLWWWPRPKQERLVEEGLQVAQVDRSRAEQLFREALASGPNADAQVALAIVLSRRGAWEDALKAFAAADKSAGRANLLLDFGERAYGAGYLAVAREAWDEVRSRGTRESVKALEFLAFDAAEWERQQDLVDSTRALAALEPTRPVRWRELIDLLRSMQRDAECLAAIEEALAQPLPEDVLLDFRHQRIDRLIVGGDATRAQEEIDRLEEEFGESLRLKSDKIDLYRLQGEVDRALELVNEIFPEIQARPDAYFVRGSLLLDVGRFAEAVADLERAIVLNPFSEKTRFKLAQAYQALQRPDDSQRERKAAEAIVRKRGRIGELLNQIGQKPRSRKICSELASLHRDLNEVDLARRWEARAAQAPDE